MKIKTFLFLLILKKLQMNIKVYFVFVFVFFKEKMYTDHFSYTDTYTFFFSK